MREIWKMSTKVWFSNRVEFQGSNEAVNIRTTFNLFSVFSVPTKVKKTDLPVIPPESEILPSLDDSDDNFSDDLEDDEDLGKICQEPYFRLGILTKLLMFQQMTKMKWWLMNH